MHDLTLAIPFYRSAEFLPQLLESILIQKIKPGKIIFLNDCSPDHSIELVNAFIGQHPELLITLLQNEYNKGIASSYNRLINECSTQWLHIVDADDHLLKDYYTHVQTQLSDANTGVIVTGAKSNSFLFNLLNRLIAPLIPRHIPLSLQLLGFITVRSGIIYNKKFLPFFTDPLFDGSDIIHLNSIREKNAAVFIKKSKIFYRIHTSATTGKMDLQSYRNYLCTLTGMRKFFHHVDFLFRKRIFSFIRKLS